MDGKRRVLVIDDEPSGEELKQSLEEQLGLNGLPVHVALAKTHEQIERLLWITRTARKGGVRKKPRHFDLGAVNLNANFKHAGPLPAALELQDRRKTPVLIYSPPYTGRVVQLESMVAGTFAKVCDMPSIPDAALLHLLAPEKAGTFLSLLSTARTLVGQEARAVQQKIAELIASMETMTRIACERILAREKVQWGLT